MDSMHILLALTCLLTVPAPSAQNAAQPPRRQDCSAPEHRQFDFWLGDWDVVAGGKPAGRNRITADLGGCVLVEQWTSAAGGRGTSLNFYDRTTGTWIQTWIDAGGNALRLSGGLRDGRMVLEGDASGTRQRITWSPSQDGSVRQHWEQSADGVTWTTAFDGKYTRQQAGQGGR